MKKKSICFSVEIDENNLPVNIVMNADNNEKKEDPMKALLLSTWSAERKETLRIDLWTKDMQVHDMFILYHQTLSSLANSLERSTGQHKLADAMRDYCEFFAKETKIQS
tara:strand:- start:259 stop:585 length:327 start_codon:yes stop_codon:yes gene_type:complete